MREVVPDPDRLSRVHVVGVRLDRSSIFVVMMSDGTGITWDEWCSWGRFAFRTPSPNPHEVDHA